MTPMIIILIALAVAALLLMVYACCVVSARCSREEEAQRRVIELPPVNPSHDPEPEATHPPGAVDKPDVVAVSRPNPKMTPMEALQAANANREMAARLRASAAAAELRMGVSVDHICRHYSYKTPDSLRKALSRYGYRSNGQRKEVPHDA